jgi:ubiquinone biosynthesis protein COQ9
MSDENPYLDTQQAILDAALPEIGFSGWRDETLAQAAETAGIEAHMAVLAFPNGVSDLIGFFSATGDRLMLDALPEADGLKIRERIAQAVMVRLEVDAAHREAARLAAAYLSVPGRHAHAAKMLFETAHLMWRWAGDTATDYNYYTKRTILSGVIASTRLVWFDDDHPEHQETQAFLDRRIDNVMQFEKVKGKLTKAVAKMQEEGSGLEQALDKLAQWRFRNDAK